MIKALAISTILSGALLAIDRPLIFDPYFSPYAGADDLLSAHELLEKAQLERLSQPLFERSPFLQRIGRLSELVFFWDPVNSFSILTQHEVFGHGFRVRSLNHANGAEVTHYNLDLPPPYGRGGGVTHFRWYPEITTIFEFSSICASGVESTAILANKTRLNWLRTGKIIPQQCTLYSLSQHDITHYILQTKETGGGDMLEYIFLMNGIYADKKLSVASMKKRVLINFLDPFTYYSFYAWFKYVKSGKKTSIPMIQIGQYQYLPSARMGLTPFGPEYYLENFLLKGEKPVYFYLRNGYFANHLYTGIGIEHPYMWEGKGQSLGLRADIWLQPDVDFRDPQFFFHSLIKNRTPNIHFDSSRFGASVSLMYQTKLWSTGSLFLQLGGKSDGYVPGEELSSGLIARIGLTLW